MISEFFMPTVIYLMGPTASGKTDLALELATRMPCEIISVDSGMIYRGMDIGTAKPNPEQLILSPHHLIDIIDPGQSYSAGEFRRDALLEIEKIFAKGKIPLLVGGTMLYFRILAKGISPLPPADLELRKKISLVAKEKGWAALHERLRQLDPVSGARISPADTQRIQRALEVYELTGSTLTSLCQANLPQPFPYNILKIALFPVDRIWLSSRISSRLEVMIRAGFISEVETLFAREDLHRDLPSIRAVGYRQVWQYLEGTISYDEMLNQILISTRQLAKRQLTWLRSCKDAHQFDPNNPKLICQILNLMQNTIH
jgi:tRNA dimethylallyltransferase